MDVTTYDKNARERLNNDLFLVELFVHQTLNTLYCTVEYTLKLRRIAKMGTSEFFQKGEREFLGT